MVKHFKCFYCDNVNKCFYCDNVKSILKTNTFRIMCFLNTHFTTQRFPNHSRTAHQHKVASCLNSPRDLITTFPLFRTLIGPVADVVIFIIETTFRIPKIKIHVFTENRFQYITIYRPLLSQPNLFPQLRNVDIVRATVLVSHRCIPSCWCPSGRPRMLLCSLL